MLEKRQSRLFLRIFFVCCSRSFSPRNPWQHYMLHRLRNFVSPLQAKKIRYRKFCDILFSAKSHRLAGFHAPASLHSNFVVVRQRLKPFGTRESSSRYHIPMHQTYFALLISHSNHSPTHAYFASSKTALA